MKKHQGITRFLSISAIIIFLFSQMNFTIVKASSNGNSGNNNASLSNGEAAPSNIVREAEQEFTINFAVQPEEIRAKDVTVNTGAYKEIVLVMDTSGSMGDKLDKEQKLTTLKKIASNFIDKFSSDSKASIAAVGYNVSAEILGEGLVNSSKFQDLKNRINSLSAEGSTNTGDGLRKAYYLLNNGRADAKKYIILITDGAPTAYTAKSGTVNYTESFLYKQGVITDSNEETEFSSITSKKFETSDAPVGTYVSYYGDRAQIDAMNYVQNIGNLIKAKESIKSFVVGFGYGINSPELSEIARAINGKKVKANNKNQINKIYEEIAKAISSTISTEANFYLTVPNGIEVTNLPEGLEYNDGAISGTVKTINYSIEDDGNNGGGNDYYKAEPVNFSISFKGKITNTSLIQQDYKITGESTYLSYVVSDKEYKHYFNDVDIKINNKVTLKAPIKTTQALASGVDKDKLKVNDSFNINYTIDPSEGIEKIKNDSLYKKNKEIILVVDTSGSMAWDINGNNVTGNRVYCSEEEAKKHTNWGRERVWTFWPYYYEWRYYYINSQDSRLNLAKDAIDIFLNKFQNDSKTNIGLVTYSDKAYIKKDFGDNISSQDVGDAEGGTNTGDGLRKAYYMLKNSNDADKYIVLLTDGAPTSYSVGRNDSYYNYNYILDNSENYKVFGGYSYDKPEATEYAKEMMEKINNDTSTKINTFLVGFTSGADSSALNEIANASENVKVIQATSSSEIQQVYNGIAEEIKLPTVKDIKFQVKLPEGLIAQEVKYINSQTPVENLSIEEGGKVIVGSLDNINYNLIKKINNIDYYTVDDSILEKLKFTVKVKATKAGDYLLGNEENASSISYTDVDGSSYVNRFTPEISLKVIDEQAPISITKFGIFTSKVAAGQEGTIESYIKSGEAQVISGFTYTLGSLLDIGYAKEDDIGKPLGEDLTLNISTNGIDFRGNSTFMLYTIVNGKLTLMENWKNISNGQISISGNKLNMGQKYIITQNFVPYIFDSNQSEIDIYNSITINSVVNTINSIKLLSNTELPDLD
ncbi:von Willebrand factor type A domain protein [Clostridium homopropionicum DSM 5847]|uniref:von Willebrand factor type A domain protein n=1 Tax=Clostridium homopropionicum DSM 5847 TaxID=1121318 RepID=A0A0L6ZEN2_9CLOT|nr:VWA domain-containing protein [Clostridium homopropionicum]KOA21412.1 von Willebrand factor type A domain protein [Clostridium homopropionicum DSM 5847]SFG10703.1 von Willebrand factor type A domain-containing protein [Clostridium homopropionicum]